MTSRAGIYIEEDTPAGFEPSGKIKMQQRIVEPDEDDKQFYVLSLIQQPGRRVTELFETGLEYSGQCSMDFFPELYQKSLQHLTTNSVVKRLN